MNHHIVYCHMLVHTPDTFLQIIQQLTALPFCSILISIPHDGSENRAVHMEGQTSLQQFLQRKRKLVQIFIAKHMAIFLVNCTKIFNIDQKNLERFFFSNSTINLCKEAMPVIQLCQGMHTLALPLECQEQHCFHQHHQKTIEHNLRTRTLNHNAQGNNRKQLRQHPAHRTARILPIPKITNAYQRQLQQRDNISNRIQRTPIIFTTLVKIEKATIPDI